MTGHLDPEQPDATALAAAFAAGRSSPRRSLEGFLARIERLDPVVGACNGLAEHSALFATAEAAGARWRAGTPRSALDGVPFGVKANIAVAGMPWHAGIGAMRDRIARVDAVCVTRLRAAGMMPIAVLNMHEAALGVTSANPAFRTTHNPWAPQRIPGGSSGGSAAAVASGMVPLALGTDDLGSVRLPSALCGVLGFKPAYGEVPTGGVEPLCAALDHVGIHARSVRDASAVFSILRGRHGATEPRGLVATRPLPSVAPWIQGDPGAVDQSVVAALRPAMEHMHRHAPVGEPLDWSRVDLSRLRRAGLLLCERDAARHFADILRERPTGFSAEFRKLVAWGAAQSDAKVRAARTTVARARDGVLGALGDRLLACPTTPHSAPLRDGPIPAGLADFTVAPAIAGVAAISVPAGYDENGLPVGLQLVGAQDDVVLAAAAELFPGAAPVAEPAVPPRRQ